MIINLKNHIFGQLQMGCQISSGLQTSALLFLQRPLLIQHDPGYDNILIISAEHNQDESPSVN